MLIPGSERELHENSNVWNSALVYIETKINKSKTKVTAISDTRKDTKIDVERIMIEQVKVFQQATYTYEDTMYRIKERVGNGSKYTIP